MQEVGLTCVNINKDILREDLKIQVSRLAVFVKPQFTIVNEDFKKKA